MKEFWDYSATPCIGLSHDREPVPYQKLTLLKPHDSRNWAVISFVYISLQKLCMKCNFSDSVELVYYSSGKKI
jgi:hypothetical protein